MTGQNISNDSDKACKTFNEPSVYQGIKVWLCNVSDTDGRTDRRNTLVVNWRARRKENENIEDGHID